MMRALLLTLCTLLTFTAFAQPSYPPPTGVYCSCGPTTGKGYGSVNPTIAAKPFVKGILVRIPWELMEPSDNSYNWQLLDDQITAANQYGKKISLGITAGPSIPQWVFSGGAQRLISTSPINDTIAIPWDGYYLSKWKEFISALGSRYENDTTIQLVYISHSTANGMEMQLPRTTTPTLAAAGYTDQKMIDSWKEVIQSFDTAFPNHYLSNDFHPVNGSDVVADSVYAYATRTIGNRYGAAAWWWTQKNATTVYPAQYNILKHSATNNNFTSVQFAQSGTSDSAKYGAGGMPGAMQLAIADGICYWELWNEDLLNPKFDSLLSAVNCSTVSIETTTVPQLALPIYPNPSTGVVTIPIPTLASTHIVVANIAGQLVYTRTISNRRQISIDLTTQPKGIYTIRLTNQQHSYTNKLILE